MFDVQMLGAVQCAVIAAGAGLVTHDIGAVTSNCDAGGIRTARVRCSRGSSLGEGCINRLSRGTLTLAAAAASHSIRRMNELKVAAHVLAVRAREVGEHFAGVVRDELRTGVPEAPVASPASAVAVATPSRPQRAEVIDGRIARDLEE